MPQATPDDLFFARTGTKPILTFRWTDSRARIIPFKYKADEYAKVWKRWKERQGWRVRGASPNHIAESPDGVFEACALRIYDPGTLQEVE